MICVGRLPVCSHRSSSLPKEINKWEANKWRFKQVNRKQYLNPTRPVSDGCLCICRADTQRYRHFSLPAVRPRLKPDFYTRQNFLSTFSCIVGILSWDSWRSWCRICISFYSWRNNQALLRAEFIVLYSTLRLGELVQNTKKETFLSTSMPLSADSAALVPLIIAFACMNPKCNRFFTNLYG